MAWASLATGRATASQLDAFIAPRVRRSDKPPVVFLHGVSGDASQAMGGGTTPSSRLVTTAIADAGYAVGAPTAPTTWGNSTGRSRLDDVVAVLRSSYGATNAKMVLVGASHGSTWALNYAVANPTLVACCICILPGVDLQYVRDNNVLSLQAGIDTALGNPMPSTSNPALNESVLATIPTQLWYSADDTFSTNIAAYATATKADLHNLSGLGHTDAAIAAADRDSIISFIKAHS